MLIDILFKSKFLYPRCKELETELEKSQKENALLRQQLNDVRQISSPSLSGLWCVVSFFWRLTESYLKNNLFLTDTVSQSPGNASAAGLQCVTPMMTSIAKVVQPTATVSSVPVSGPSTYFTFQTHRKVDSSINFISFALIQWQELHDQWVLVNTYVM